MTTSLVVSINTTSNNTTDNGNFVVMDLVNDKLIFSDGSAAVVDGADTPTPAELNEAAPLVPVANYEVPKLFLLDYSDTGQELKLIHLAGSAADGGSGGDYRYVLRFYFDGATATEPTLEAWDTNGHSTNALVVLGASTGANSMIRVVRTTAGAPGASWSGTPISGASNKSQMNGGGGALAIATTIYYNIKTLFTAARTPAAEVPILCVRFTWV